jgi:hypothetical protein
MQEEYHTEAALVMRELVAANLTLFPVSPQGLLATHGDSMSEMAELTGGKAFLGSNDDAGLVRDAMDEPREGYLLTFVPRGGHGSRPIEPVAQSFLHNRPLGCQD